GQPRAAGAATPDAGSPPTRLAAAAPRKYGKPRLINAAGARPRQRPARFDHGDAGGEFGAPMDRVAVTELGSGRQPPRGGGAVGGAGAGPVVDYTALGMTRAEFESLSPSQQRALLEQLRDRRARQARALLERSAERNGTQLEL
ncbi:MAG: hypothetical protein VX569_02890, partial [Pseudomonadota bacterium]|nr:hypothetical protein [Pseudomonadota bacterium]